MLKINFMCFAAVLVICKGSPVGDDGSWKIVGGTEAAPGAAPYQIILKVWDSFKCSGSIISKRTILTAAHCVVRDYPISVTIIVGTNDLSIGGVSYEAEFIYVRDDFDNQLLSNDVAVIILRKDIEFSDTVTSIALKTEDVSGDIPATLTGWGTTQLGGIPAEKLQIIEVMTISMQDCQKRWIGSQVLASQICTLTRRGEGACHGDSGGPLVVNNKLAGIVSWGNPCANGFPDVYSRVSSYIDWIQAHTV